MIRRVLLALALLAWPALASAQVTITTASWFTGTGLALGAITIPVNGIATTSTDAILVTNQTAATGGVTVQMSPRIRWCGNAWDTAASESTCFSWEVLPATAATPTATAKLIFSLNGGAATTPMTVASNGDLAVASNITYNSGSLVSNNSNSGVSVGFTGGLVFVPGRTKVVAPADAQLNILNTATTAGIGLNVATDNILLIRNRAQNADAAITAAFHNSSTVTTLTVTTNVIAPTSTLHHLGAGLVKTITVPTTCTPTCVIHIVPDAAYTYDATGNILLPAGGGTATINRLMTFSWDGTKWNPSY